MGPEPSHFKGEFRPVEQVNWHEAQAVARWLSERLPELAPALKGLQSRLPTEAEWEYAIRLALVPAQDKRSPKSG